MWIKGHVGIRPNEVDDEFAKRAVTEGMRYRVNPDWNNFLAITTQEIDIEW